ncbi:MAG: hypothetical protein WCL27_02280 [Betaproteobacteria bacterium]
MAKDYKDKVVTIRMTTDDLLLLDTRCSELGMTRSEFIYEQLFAEHKRRDMAKEMQALEKMIAMVLASQINFDLTSKIKRTDGESEEQYQARLRARAATYTQQLLPAAKSQLEGYRTGYEWSDPL